MKAREELLKGSRLEQAIDFKNNGRFDKIGGLKTEENEFINISVAEKDRIEREKEEQNRKLEIQLVRALKSSSENNLLLNRDLDSLIDILKAAKILKQSLLSQLFKPDIQLQDQVRLTLQKAIYQVKEKNIIKIQDSVEEIDKKLSSLNQWVNLDDPFVSPDETLKVINDNGTTSLLSTNSQQKLAHLEPHLFSSNIPNSSSFSPDSKLIATAGYLDDTIRLWNSQGHQLAEFKANQGGIIDIRFSADGEQLATIGRDNTIRIWQDLAGKHLREIIEYQDKDNYFTDAIVSADGQRLAVSDGQGFLSIWNLSNSQKTELSQQFTDISELHFSPDNRSLAISESNGTIHWWDLENEQELTSFTVEEANIDQFGSFVRDYCGHLLQGISFSKQGEWLAIGGDNNILVRSSDGQEQARFPEGPSPEEGNIVPNWVQATSFNSTGNIVATGGIGGSVRLWNWKQRKPILAKPIKANTNQTRKVIFSSKGNLIATAGLDGSNPGVCLWNLSGEKLAKFDGHKSSVNQIVFSPDEKLLATASSDNTIRIWDLSGQQLVEFQALTAVQSIAFTLDSKQLVTTEIVYPTNDTPTFLSVKWWQIEDFDELFMRGCKWVYDYLENNPEIKEEDRQLCNSLI